jgi:large subunit ribosomal protein L1
MKRSRRYREIKEKITLDKHYSLSESLKFLQDNNQEKNLKNIKASFSLSWVNQKNTLKSKVILPNPISPKDKLAIIKDDLPIEIADKLQGNKDIELLSIVELRQRVEGKKKSQWGFFRLLGHPHNEVKIKSLEKILGPKGIYPNKKNGLLTENILAEVEKFFQGERELKTDKGGNIHALVGETDFSFEQLEENYKVLYNRIISLRPIGWKGDFLKNITLSTTMGPGLKILL